VVWGAGKREKWVKLGSCGQRFGYRRHWVNDDEWGEGENEEIDIDEGVAVKVT